MRTAIFREIRIRSVDSQFGAASRKMRLATWIAAVALVSSLPARAATITPVRVLASSFYSPQQNSINLINNMGLDITSGSIGSMTQAVDSSASNMWHAGTGQGFGGAAPAVTSTFLVFDLGANYDLTAADLWQFAQTNLTARGISNFTLLGSSAAPDIATWQTFPTSYNTAGFTPLLSNAQLNQAANNTPTSPQNFALAGGNNIRQVYVQINSAWSGAASEYVGLSKVKFEGTATTGTSSVWTGAAFSGAVQSDTDLFFPNNATQTVTLSNPLEARSLNVSAGNYTFQADPNGRLTVNTINVTNGASVTLPDYYGGQVTFFNPDPTPGYLPNTTGANTINVDGAGSSVTFPVSSLSQLPGDTTFSALHSNTALNITNGGVATFADDVKFGNRNGSSTVTVDGVGSRLVVTDTTGESAFGYGNLASSNITEYGTGALSLTNGGAAQFSGDMHIGAYGGRGIVYVGRTDGTDTAPAQLTANAIIMGAGANSAGAELRVGPKGAVALSDRLGTYTNACNVYLAGGSITAGRLDMNNSTMSWTSGTLTLTGGTASQSNYGNAGQTFIVPAAGTLRGSTTFSTRLFVNGTVSPGINPDDTGTIATKNLSITNGAIYDDDIDLTSLTSDLINVTGSVTLSSGSKLNLDLLSIPPSAFTSQTFIIIQNDASDAVIGSFSSIINGQPGFQYSVNYKFSGAAVNGTGTGNDVAVTITAVPEPGTIAVAGLPAAFLVLRRRKYRRRR
ncbi:MAG TPA: hypothetical protein VH518_17560 [Tepidisphaeraceae bacterium]